MRAKEGWRDVWTVEDAPDTDFGPPGTEQPILSKSFKPTVLSRKTDPFNPSRVATVLSEITVGEDLSPSEKSAVLDLLTEFADCFALSVNEVNTVEGAEHRFNIPEGATFRTKVNQRPLSPPQRVFFDGVLDKMLEAEIIRPISHREVKCCGATTLAKKAH
ncbi:hypothetical protein CPC08DRAFT_650889, partial [Agrocybe pediades]